MKLLAVNIGGGGVGTTLPSYSINIPVLDKINKLQIQDIVSFVIMLLLTVAVLLSFFFLLFGGLKWILSQGDKKKVDEAQKTITFSIIGLIVVFISFFILNFIGFLFIHGPLKWSP